MKCAHTHTRTHTGINKQLDAIGLACLFFSMVWRKRGLLIWQKRDLVKRPRACLSLLLHSMDPFSNYPILYCFFVLYYIILFLCFIAIFFYTSVKRGLYYTQKRPTLVSKEAYTISVLYCHTLPIVWSWSYYDPFQLIFLRYVCVVCVCVYVCVCLCVCLCVRISLVLISSD